MKSVAERFWSKVEKTSDCWHWRGCHFRCGYGSFKYQGKATGSHRIAWMLTNGIIPTGLDVLHRCDVRSCVNPNHLFVGSHSDNMADMKAKGRIGIRHRGEHHHKAKLTLGQVAFIRDSKDSSLTLAKTMPVDASTIRKIRRSQIWQFAEATKS